MSKVSRVNLVELAVKAMIGQPAANRKTTLDLDYVGVKAPQFSFSRLKGADPILGVEMASTGEVGCLGRDVHEALLKAILSTGFVRPERNVFISLGGDTAKVRFLESARKLKEMGYHLYATEHTSAFLKKRGVDNERLHKVHERRKPNIKDWIAQGRIHLLISIPNPEDKTEFDSYYLLRRRAVDFSVPLLTNLQMAELVVQAMAAKRPADLEIKHWGEYR